MLVSLWSPFRRLENILRSSLCAATNVCHLAFAPWERTRLRKSFVKDRLSATSLTSVAFWAEIAATGED